MEVEPHPRAQEDHAAAFTHRDSSGSQRGVPANPDKPVVSAIPTGWRIEPMGDRCLIVEFGQRVDEEINRTARSVADYLMAHPIEGVVDIVPAFTSVAVHYRPEALADSSTREPPHRRLRTTDRGDPRARRRSPTRRSPARGSAGVLRRRLWAGPRRSRCGMRPLAGTGDRAAWRVASRRLHAWLRPGVSVPRRARPAARDAKARDAAHQDSSGHRGHRTRADRHLFARNAGRVESDRAHAAQAVHAAGESSLSAPIGRQRALRADFARALPEPSRRSKRERAGREAGRAVDVAGSGAFRISALWRRRRRRDGCVVAPRGQSAGGQSRIRGDARNHADRTQSRVRRNGADRALRRRSVAPDRRAPVTAGPAGAAEGWQPARLRPAPVRLPRVSGGAWRLSCGAGDGQQEHVPSRGLRGISRSRVAQGR